jgi:hypothetical protein
VRQANFLFYMNSNSNSNSNHQNITSIKHTLHRPKHKPKHGNLLLLLCIHSCSITSTTDQGLQIQ